MKLADAKTVEDRVVAKPKKNPKDVAMEQKISDVLAMDKAAFSCESRIKPRRIEMLDFMLGRPARRLRYLISVTIIQSVGGYCLV